MNFGCCSKVIVDCDNDLNNDSSVKRNGDGGKRQGIKAFAPSTFPRRVSNGKVADG